MGIRINIEVVNNNDVLYTVRYIRERSERPSDEEVPTVAQVVRLGPSTVITCYNFREFVARPKAADRPIFTRHSAFGDGNTEVEIQKPLNGRKYPRVLIQRRDFQPGEETIQNGIHFRVNIV